MEASRFVAPVETKTETGEELQPDLRLVPPFDPEALAMQLEQYLFSADDGDDRVELLVDTVKKLPPYSVDLAQEMAASEDFDVLQSALIVIPEILRRSISVNAFPSEELDMLRDTLKELMNHEDEDVRSDAQNWFKKEEPYLLAQDVTTHGWLKGSVIEEEEKSGWRFSDDCDLKRQTKHTRQLDYIYDSSGKVIGVNR